MTRLPEQEREAQPRHIELNFGPSVYTTYRPLNHVEPDMIVRIPIGEPLGTLPDYVSRNFLNLKIKRKHKLSRELIKSWEK
ncbi:hypothetical protein A3H81_03460 [Candidatus Daviesbacteria bacterium RIFCSPLOWO2_02_FULL_38_18]|nr:MAG: hypothetical protein A3H81_03460 [Candidatus Daviesbacteria bacterium RIFCSPLOWO2_02_FULL_38_18]